MFLVIFWDSFLVPFFVASWLHLGSQKMPQGATRRHLLAPKTAKKQCVFFVFFAHRLFRRFDASLCLLGPFLVPTLPLQGRFWHPFWTQNRLQTRLTEKALATQHNPGLLRLLAKEKPRTKVGKTKGATKSCKVLLHAASVAFLPLARDKRTLDAWYQRISVGTIQSAESEVGGCQESMVLTVVVYVDSAVANAGYSFDADEVELGPSNFVVLNFELL